MSKNFPTSEENRIKKLGLPQLQQELAQAAALKGVKAAMAAEKIKFITALIGGKSKPLDAPQKTPEQLESAHLRGIERQWNAPYQELLGHLQSSYPRLGSGTEYEGNFFVKQQSDGMKIVGQLGLDALARNIIRMQWAPDHATVLKGIGYETTVSAMAHRAPAGIADPESICIHTINSSINHPFSFIGAYEVPMTPECAALEMAAKTVSTTNQNGGYEIRFSERSQDEARDGFSATQIYYGVLLEGSKFMSKGKTSEEAHRVCEELGIHTFPKLQDLIHDNDSFEPVVQRICRQLTRKPAQSMAEHYTRLSIAIASLHEPIPEMGGVNLNLIPRWTPATRVTQDDPEWEGVKSSLAHLNVPPDDLLFIKNAKGISFLVKNASLPSDSPLRGYEHPDYEDTLDLTVALDQETDESANAQTNERAWLGGTLPLHETLLLADMKSDILREIDRLEKKATSMNLEEHEHAYMRYAFDRIRSYNWSLSYNPAVTAVQLKNDNQPPLTHFNPDSPQEKRTIRTSSAPCTPAWRTLGMLFVALRESHANDPDSEFATLPKTFDFVHLYPHRTVPQVMTFSEEDMASDPTAYAHYVRMHTRRVTRMYPLSEAECLDRMRFAMGYNRQLSEQRQYLAAQAMLLKPVPIHVEHDESLREHLEIFDGGLCESERVAYARMPYGPTCFVCRKEDLPESLRTCVDDDVENTLDLVVNLNLQDEDALENDVWVSGTLPSIEQLESELFAQDFVVDKFFANHKDAETSPPKEKPAPAVGGEDNSRAEQKPIPRTKQLRNALLRNRWKAIFTVDDRTSAPSTAQYATAEPGHYVLVSIPEAKLQILISDDHSKGTYVLRNLIQPDEFTNISSIDELTAKYGATPPRYSSLSQFRSVLETEIREQIKNPMTIYPVASSYPTPLDSYPNPEAFAALQRDFEMVVNLAGKQSIDDVTVHDFETIRSRDTRWSFGGVAGGAAYLDRLATEMGLHASALNNRNSRNLRRLDAATAKNAAEPGEDAKDGEYYRNESARLQALVSAPAEQPRYRERILRMILWDLSETYRASRSEMYAKKAKNGRWHNLTERETRSDKKKGNSNHTTPEKSAEQ